MTPPDLGTLYDIGKWAIGVIISVASTAIVYIVKSHQSQINATRSDIDQVRKEHADFKLEAAEKYVRTEDFARLEERLDKRFDRTDEQFDDLRKLIIESRGGGRR